MEWVGVIMGVAVGC